MTVSDRIEQITGTRVLDAICYSGYRKGQSPVHGIYPDYQQIKEDLGIIKEYWNCIRIYDCSRHAELTLEVIKNEYPDMRVMLGVDLHAEVNNPDCPWGHPVSTEQLEENRRYNEAQVQRAIQLSNEYGEYIFAVSGGNEATVDWTDGLVPVPRVAMYLQELREKQSRPVTLCENNIPWHDKISSLVPLLDFISIHTYPAWLNEPLDTAMEMTKQDYETVAELYPDKPVIITEAGWTTRSDGRGIKPEGASARHQSRYCSELAAWSRASAVPVFMFEAFDEPWKGSENPDEPEKHWGFFYEDRSPKPVMAAFVNSKKTSTS
ncbi:glycosyl hydrolase family 17 protein [Spirochaeta dissipatitropha]